MGGGNFACLCANAVRANLIASGKLKIGPGAAKPANQPRVSELGLSREAARNGTGIGKMSETLPPRRPIPASITISGFPLVGRSPHLFVVVPQMLFTISQCHCTGMPTAAAPRRARGGVHLAVRPRVIP